MEFFYDFLKDVVRGFVRATSTYVFYKFIFKTRKPPDAVASIGVVLVNKSLWQPSACTAKAARREVTDSLLFLSISIIYEIHAYSYKVLPFVHSYYQCHTLHMGQPFSHQTHLLKEIFIAFKTT